MKRTYYSLLILGIAALVFTGCKSMNLAGKSYTGKPQKNQGQPGLEGLGQAGEVKFAEKKVRFMLPGSDEMMGGTYSISGRKVLVKDISGKNYEFILKEDGRVLEVLGDELRRSDYPW